MTIKKVKLVKDTLEVSFTERKEDGTNKTVTETHETKPHPDLLQAFSNLRAHFGMLTGYLPIKAVKKIETPPEDLIDTFTVHGISIKTGEDEGVVITGQKTLENGKKVTVNTPFTRLGEAEESGYKFTEDLITKLERASAEVEAYLHEGKKAEDPQGRLEFAPPASNGTEDEDTLTPVGEGDDEVWENGQRPKI